MSYLPELAISEEMISQLEQEETPVRINAPQNTYYVLRAEQIIALLQMAPAVETSRSFTPAEFGLTEEEIAAYLERRARRQRAVAHAQLQKVDATLRQRLDLWHAIQAATPQPLPPDETLLQLLEEAMQKNLEAIVKPYLNNQKVHGSSSRSHCHRSCNGTPATL